MNKKIFLFFMVGLGFSNAIFSQLNQNSIFFSLNNYIDNIEYENNQGSIVKENSKLMQFNIGYVFSGSYEFSFNYSKNSSIVNNYYFYDKDSYYGFNLKYCLQSFDKIPLDFQIGYKYMYSDSYASNSYNIYIYKELAGGGNYPAIPFLSIGNSDYIHKINNFKGSHPILRAGLHLKLDVISTDNNILRDVIWLSAHVNTTNNSHYFFGFDIGLYHPIK